jgi:hypothetical protein
MALRSRTSAGIADLLQVTSLNINSVGGLTFPEQHHLLLCPFLSAPFV